MESPWLKENLKESIKSDANFVTNCTAIAADVLSSKLKLVSLVESLGDVLTDPDPKLRCQGTEILANVLHNLPKDFLIEAELNYITAFFVDRLIDHYSVTPAALKGILSIAQMEHAPHDIAVCVLQKMLQEHVQCQSLKPDDRRCVYKIFELFIHNFTADLKSLGPDFVYGFMNAIDQEKDARNLTIIFGMLPFFVRTFSLGHLKEEMFEIISCYFPVDYRPEYSNCPVSREDLSEGLQKCLVASPDFGDYCVPLLVEKLDSKLKLAKMDSFKVLIAGCEIFPADIVKTYLLDLWRIIQHEVLPGSDKDVRELGLAALRAIVQQMSRRASEKGDPRILTNVTSFVLSAGISSLGEVELNLFLPAVRMMLTVAEASPASCQEVSKKVLPVLMTQYYRETGMEQKVTVLRAFTSIIAVCEVQKVVPIYCPDLSAVWQDLPSLLLGAAQFDNPEVRKEGFHGLAVSARILDENSREILYELLKKCMNQEDHDAVRTELLLCFKKLSKIHTSEVMEKIVEVKLKDLNSLSEGGCRDMHLVLESLCEIADAEPFTSLIVPYMLQLIIDSFSLEKCTVGMNCLRKLLESCGESQIYNYMYLQCNVISRLISWWLQGVVEAKYRTIFENEEALCNTAIIMNIIIKNLESGTQNDVVTVVVPHIMNSDIKLANGSKFMPLCYSSPWNHSLVIVLLEALIGSVHQDIKIPELHKLVISLSHLAVHSTHHLIHLSACRLTANLVNKMPEGEILQQLLKEVSQKAHAVIMENTSAEAEKQSAVNLMVWITKSLVMRGYSEINLWVESLIVYMSIPLVGTIAAQGFSLIMKENEEFLNLKSFCNIRILFRQRFFSFAPKLIERFHDVNSDFKSNYLVALGHMLQGVPQEVLLMNLEKMVPLLVESLQQSEVLLLTTTLDTLHSVLKKPDLALQHHLQTFIPRILTLAKFQNCMIVRTKALQCMYQVSKYPITLILPFKNQVLKVLGECLDDHKRLVRKEAVQARSHWYLVGTHSRQH